MNSVCSASSVSDGAVAAAASPQRPSLLLVDRLSAELGPLVDRLLDEGWRVRPVDDCHAARCAVAEEPPAIIILGRLSRYLLRSEYCRMLRQIAPRPATTILVLSPPDGGRTRAQCGAEGADGFLDSLGDADGVVAMIRAMRYAGPVAPSGILVHGDVRMDLDRLKVSAAGAPIALSPSAFRLLRMFLEQPRATLSRDALMAAFRAAGTAKARTVDSHVRTLRAALARAGVRDFITTVRHGGYSLSGSGPAAHAIANNRPAPIPPRHQHDH